MSAFFLDLIISVIEKEKKYVYLLGDFNINTLDEAHTKSRTYLRFQTPPPPKFSDFFLKSEGKEIERKRKKRDVGGGGGYLLTYFWG